MANFKTVGFTPRMTTSGVSRIAKHGAGVLGTDPANMAALMSNSTYVWSSTAGWADLGGTQGGVNMTHGFAEQAYTADQSEGPYRTEVTENNYHIATSLVQVGDIEIFSEAWLAATATTVVTTTNERIKGLAAQRQVTRKSLAVAHVDEASKLRVYYFRDCGLQAGDSALNLAPNTQHVLPVNFRAYPNLGPTYVGKEFGFIMEDDGFGGVLNTP